MIEIYSKFYLLMRPIAGMLTFIESWRIKDGSTLLGWIYDTSSKQPKIWVATHTRFFSQKFMQKGIYQFSQKKSILKPYSWEKYGKNPWKI